MTWIQTYTGRKFSLLDPQPEDVCIEDIAHALTYVCRYGGHCEPFYCVAQHCVHVADLVTPDLRYAALLHDAGEAYYGDFTRPMKLALREITGFESRCGHMNHFDLFVRKIDEVVASSLGMPYPLPDEVKHADNIMLATEARDLIGPPPEPWVAMPDPLPHIVRPWMPEEVHAQFMRIYKESSS